MNTKHTPKYLKGYFDVKKTAKTDKINQTFRKLIKYVFFQSIIHNLWLGDDIKTSIDTRRLHHQLAPMTLKYEPDFPQVDRQIDRQIYRQIDS